jgi:hypothetical protein
VILVKGDEVDFVLAERGRGAGLEKRGLAIRFEPSGEEILYCPRHFVMCHDPTGTYLRRCDFYVCPYTFKACKTCDVDARSMDLFRKYYGNQVLAEKGTIAMPSGPWQKVALTDAIRYRRRHVPQRGGKTVHYKHDWNRETVRYPAPVWVEVDSSGSFRVPLPEGCVADHLGFQIP